MLLSRTKECNHEAMGAYLMKQKDTPREHSSVKAIYEVDPAVRTTGAGFSVGGEAAPSFENHRIRTSCDCCCGCGYVGNAAALSKRSVIYSHLPECAGDAVAPDRHRCPVRQRLMRPPEIVECDPSADTGLGFSPVGIALQIHVLVFERAPKAFDKNVVHPAASAIHRVSDSGSGQGSGERSAGELTALVGIEYLGFAEAGQRLLQRRNTERHVHRVR